MKKFVLLFILVYFTTVSLASPDSVDSLWQTDFDAALLSAQKTDKDLLLSFSGSDWCPWCKKLESVHTGFV